MEIPKVTGTSPCMGATSRTASTTQSASDLTARFPHLFATKTTIPSSPTLPPSTPTASASQRPSPRPVESPCHACPFYCVRLTKSVDAGGEWGKVDEWGVPKGAAI